ncbi:cell division protein FtsQ/DivIB [Cruoricaptor ignavus]|uniref:cell division protein FtsQ/DivIB n=1 Tax=Cruoricaptor ignavus TaxID=1118202 RepID=UPI00370D3C14
MKNKWRFLKIFVTVIILGFLLSFSLNRFSEKPVSEEMTAINLNTTTIPVYFVDENQIRDIVRRDNPSGKVGGINIPELERKINEIKSVDSANVYLNLNGQLNIDVHQKIPVFRLSKGNQEFYVDEQGTEFPLSKNYAHPCMLVKGNVQPEEYEKLAELVRKIDADDFCKKFFIGISKEKNNYNLLTSDGNYKVEIGDLDNIDFKVKGFKTFVEKFLVYQDQRKYSKISVKYDNQIVTTLNPNFKENEAAINSSKEKIAKAENKPEAAPKPAAKKPEKAEAKKAQPKKEEPKKEVAKKAPEKKTEKKPEPKKSETKKAEPKKAEPKKKNEAKNKEKKK